MKTLLCGIVLVLASTLLGCTHKSAAQTCVAGPDEKCPSDLTIKELDEIKAMEKKFSPPKPSDAERVRYIGLVGDFGQQKPKGYHWDDAKLRWVKDPAPIASTSPVPPPNKP